MTRDIHREKCPRCPNPPLPGRVHCARCTKVARDYMRRQSYAGTPGYAIACCGRFHAFTTIPVIVPCCHRVYFAMEGV
jgi:hypothetical protein